MDSKEALERLFGSYISSKCYGINYKQDDEDYNTIKQDLDRLEKYKIANKVFISYLTMFINDVSFDTFIASQCSEEEQEICGELLKEVLEDENNL